MIECNNVYFSIGNTVVLQNISFSLQDGEILGIIGSAGSGKSILCKIIGGIIQNHKGTILYDAIPFKESIKKSRYVEVAYCNTTAPENRDDRLIDFLYLSRIPFKKIFRNFSEYDAQVVEGYVNQFSLTEWCDYPLRSLSDSIMKKATLAFTFIREARTVILDDPTTYLDIESIFLLHRAMKRYVLNGDRSLLLCSNDINFILQAADRIIVLGNGGEIIADIPPESVNKELIEKVFHVEVILSRNIYNGRPQIHLFPEQ